MGGVIELCDYLDSLGDEARRTDRQKQRVDTLLERIGLALRHMSAGTQTLAAFPD